MSEDTLSLYFDCESNSQAEVIHSEIEKQLLDRDEEPRRSQCIVKGGQAVLTLGFGFDHEMAELLLLYLSEKEVSHIYAELYFDTAGETEFAAMRKGHLKLFKRRPPRKKINDPQKGEAYNSAVQSSPIYLHALDSEWQKQREEQWERIYWGEYDEQPKYNWQHYKDYFFTGDVDAYINGELRYLKRIGLAEDVRIINFQNLIHYSPVTTISQLEELFQKVAEWYEINADNLNLERLENKKKYFIRSLTDMASMPEHGFSPELAHEAFFWIYGDNYSFNRTFPVPLGKEQWRPLLGNHDAVFGLLVQGFYEYLFKLEFKNIAVQKRRTLYKDARYLDFLLSILSVIDVEFFDRRIHERDYVTKSGITIGVQQYMLRALVLGLYGYNVQLFSGSATFYCRDEELRETLRERVVSHDMPPEFSDFIGFIQEYKEEAFEYTE